MQNIVNNIDFKHLMHLLNTIKTNKNYPKHILATDTIQDNIYEIEGILERLNDHLNVLNKPNANLNEYIESYKSIYKEYANNEYLDNEYIATDVTTFKHGDKILQEMKNYIIDRCKKLDLLIIQTIQLKSNTSNTKTPQDAIVILNDIDNIPKLPINKQSSIKSHTSPLTSARKSLSPSSASQPHPSARKSSPPSSVRTSSSPPSARKLSPPSSARKLSLNPPTKFIKSFTDKNTNEMIISIRHVFDSDSITIDNKDSIYKNNADYFKVKLRPNVVNCTPIIDLLKTKDGVNSNNTIIIKYPKRCLDPLFLNTIPNVK